MPTAAKVSRPNRTDLDKTLSSLKKQLEEQRAKQNKAKETYGGESKSPEWRKLLDERKAVTKERDAARDAVSGVQNQVKSRDAALKKKLKDVQTLRPASGPKSVGELDKLVQRLEKAIESGSLSLKDERMTLKEISSLKNQRLLFAKADKLQTEVDNERTEIAKLRKTVDDAPLKAARKKLDEINARLDASRASSNKKDEAFQKVKGEVDVEIKRIFSEMDAARADYRQRMDAFREFEKQREAEEKEEQAKAARVKKLANAEAKVEAAKLNSAFEESIIMAESLLSVIDPSYHPENTSSSGSVSSDGPKLGTVREGRKVENGPAGAKLLKKEGASNQAPVSRKELKRKGASKSSGEASGKVQFDFTVLEGLASLHIPLPSSSADIEETKKQILSKIQFYKDNNERVTQERVERAKEELEKVKKEIELGNVEPEAQNDAGKKSKEEESKVVDPVSASA